MLLNAIKILYWKSIKLAEPATIELELVKLQKEEEKKKNPTLRMETIYHRNYKDWPWAPTS